MAGKRTFVEIADQLRVPLATSTSTRGISSADLDLLEPVDLRDDDAEAAGTTDFPVFVHGDIVDWLGSSKIQPNLKKNLTWKIQELLAHGRANRTKGVKGINAGYLRIPLGGSSGKQYYLWLFNRGEQIRRQDTRALEDRHPEGARFLRAVRHHDDTAKGQLLDVGHSSDYLQFDPRKVLSRPHAEGLADPLTEPQRNIVTSGAEIRFIQGQPGAGKTTSLHEVARRFTGRLLYLTWSRRLADRAGEWLRLSAPPEVEAEIWTFHEFVGRLDPKASLVPSPITSLESRVAALRRALLPIGGQLSAWSYGGELRASELYAELHAHLFGAALPVDFRGRKGRSDERILCWTDYRALRLEVLGQDAARQAFLAATKVVDAKLSAELCETLFPERHDASTPSQHPLIGLPLSPTLFPELHDAHDRAFDLAHGRLRLDPEVFSFDWILIDEVQDLTTLEQWLVVDVSARAGAARGIRPGLVIAGDEAQTVRPTAFEWGSLDNLVRERFGEKAVLSKHELKTNLRAPRDLARFINRIRRELYSNISKDQRPRGGQENVHTEATVSRILLVEVDADEREALVRSFAAQPDAALISTDDIAPPEWAAAAKAHSTVIWTSEEAKGLEFRVVAVLDFPDKVDEVERLADDTDRLPVGGELARSAIDRLLVAVSRSSETLVLLSTRWSAAEKQRIEDLVADRPERPISSISSDRSDTADSPDNLDASEGYLDQVSSEDLEELLELDAADARDRIEQLLDQSERLQEAGELERALRLARNAHGLLGRSGRPGAAGEEQRRQVRRRLGVLVAHLALDKRDSESLRKAQQKLRLAGRKHATVVLRDLAQLLTKTDPRALDVQQAIKSAADRLTDLQEEEPTLLRPVIEYLAVHLGKVTSGPSTRKGRQVLASALSHLASCAPLARERFQELRSRLMLKMLDELADGATAALRRDFEELRSGLDDQPQLASLDARHAEAKGEHEDAAQRWQALGDRAGAMRCIRRVGDLRATERIARALGSQEDDLAPMKWGVRVLDALEAPPPGGVHRADVDALRRSIELLLGKIKVRDD